MVAFAANELAIDFSFWELIIIAGRDDWWFLLFLHDDGHGIASCVSLVLLFGGSDHPQSCGII